MQDPIEKRDNEGECRFAEVQHHAPSSVACPLSLSSLPATNSRSSPGWHCNSRHSASSVVKRIARALLVLRIDRLASVMPTFSASSVSETRRSSMTRSRLSLMAMARSNRQVVFGFERQSLAEHLRQSEHQETGEEDWAAALAVREGDARHRRQMQLLSLDGERGVTGGIAIRRMPEPALAKRRHDRECEQRQADELNQEHGLAGEALAAFDVAKEPAQQFEQDAEKDDMHQRHRQAVAHQHPHESAGLFDRDGDGVAQRRDSEIGIDADGSKHDRAGLAEDVDLLRTEMEAGRKTGIDDHRQTDADRGDRHQHDHD